MNDGHDYEYPRAVATTVEVDDPPAYVEAAKYLNGACDVVCVQHEFGIFGGVAGSHVLDLYDGLEVPVVTTLHTILRDPTEAQRHVMKGILAKSAHVVAMGRKGREILRDVYHADPNRIALVPHGVPDLDPEPPDRAKGALGLQGKTVLLTFGLLGPGKGLETVVRALPRVAAHDPSVLYVVLGATHPNEKAANGEAYRESLADLARELKVESHLRFVDEFVTQRRLVEHLRAADVYVTPYPHLEQVTSGTLAMAAGLGKAIVSTPFWHAEELLADGRGLLFPACDCDALATKLLAVLQDRGLRDRMARSVGEVGRKMRWSVVGRAYREVFETVLERASAPRSRVFLFPASPVSARAEVPVRHLERLTDDVGLLQHATFTTPNRDAGYCTDDNARALLVGLRLGPRGERWTRLGLAFLAHAWNPSKRRFRNFMGYDRRWLDEQGSEDAQGRAMMSLGAASSRADDPGVRALARGLFEEALPSLEETTSLRTAAFGLMGIEAVLGGKVDESQTAQLGRRLADRLLAAYSDCADFEWRWFEDKLTYDNARLPQGLLCAFRVLRDPLMLETALEAFEWLCGRQTSAQGIFCPVGSNGFAERDGTRAWFDQQPLEAAATVEASLDALELTGDPRWRREAERAYNWFGGSNLAGIPLADPETGGCRDGLHAERANENQGAESTLSYLAARLRMNALVNAAEPVKALGTTA